MPGSTDLLNQVAPFFLVWSLDGVLVDASPAICDLWSLEDELSDLETRLRLHRPFAAAMDPAWLPELTYLLLHLGIEGPCEALLKGQVIRHGDSWIFVGGPLVSSVKDLEKIGLTLTDLPIHDSAGDLLIAIEANRISLLETQTRARELSAAVNDLRVLNRSLSSLVPTDVLDTLGLDMGAEGSVQFSAEAVGRFIERLQHALEFRETFLANMSHELRTPLNAILGISEVMQEGIYGEMTPKQQEMLETVTKSGDHLLSLINDILDLSKIEAGEATLSLQECNLEVLCETALRMSRPREANPMVSYRMDYRSSHRAISVDRRRIRQVLLNLLSNASKFTDEGEISLTVEDIPEENSITIRVQDTGIGVPPEHLEHLFEPFYQVDHGLSRAHQGTGLGLAITQRVVQLHGGRIEAESQQGQGSSFFIVLPVDPQRIRVPTLVEEISESSKEQNSSGQSKESWIKARPDSRLKGEKVLVVDAEPLNRIHLVDYLGEVGLEVTEADDGQAALESILMHPPAVLLMDIDLSGIGGLDLIRCLRLLPQTMALPIVVLTGRATTMDRERTLAAGANEFFVKPYKVSELPSVIRRLLSA